MKKRALVIVGIIGILVGLAFICPAVAQWKHTGSMAGVELALFLLGIILSVAGLWGTFAGFFRCPNSSM